MIGKIVGHYRILSKIGEGGMGEVFLSEDIRLERKAAVKFLPAETANDPSLRQRFLREAKAASALNHPHVCTVYDVGETDDGVPFIAMEFVEGQSLDKLLKAGPVEVSKVVDIAMQAADALDAAHVSRIVHRDIKPANICMSDRGNVKVLDFGLAKRLATESSGDLDVTSEMQQTKAGHAVGTPSFMSPEQARGKDVDHRSDLFSLGSVIYSLLTGRSPFPGSNLGEVLEGVLRRNPDAIARFNYDVPPELERITLKLLTKEVDSRYQSAHDLIVDLKSLKQALKSGSDAPGHQDGFLRSGQAFDQATVGTSGVVGQPQGEPTHEPLSVEQLKNSDVLLNYASIDDHSLQDGKPGWVSQLHRNLEVRMEQLSGEKVNVARLGEASVSPAVQGELMEYVPQAKAMISVVSPPFVHSEFCQREVEHFWQGAEETGGRWVDEKSRLLKVLKTAIPEDQMPSQMVDIFSPLFGFEFFELDAETGRVREFDETFGPALKQRFFERVYDLAYDTCQVLSVLKQVRDADDPNVVADPNRQWVYLATTTSDVQDERDRIKRELLERGHVVLPDGPLPMLAYDAERTVGECLDKCSMAIHLLGRRYGVTPEDSAESIPALQVRLSAERLELQRLMWMPGDGEIADQRQQEFIVRVQEDPVLHDGAEIIEGNLNLLKKDLIRRLTPPEEETKPPPDAKPSSGAPRLYLICDAKDEEHVEPLEDYLFDQGLEVSLPAFDGDDADAAALHQENLLSCDAVLVYYGAAPKAWVDIKLRELLKAAGYGRETSIDVQAVYIAPPEDRRKDRYRSHQASVIRQGAEFEPSAELEAFVNQVKEVMA